MIGIYLIAAHLVGDYLFQTRWQAMGKFGWTPDAMKLRFYHCTVYTFCFTPIAARTDIYSYTAFLVLLFVLHFLTDAQRFQRTPGEWIVWRSKLPVKPYPGTKPLEPNPWPSIGLAIDQSLHILQIAVLAGLFL